MDNLDKALNSLKKAKEKVGDSEVSLLLEDTEQEIQKHQNQLNEFGIEELEDDQFEVPF